MTNIGVTVSALLQQPFPGKVGGPEGGKYVHVTTGAYTLQDYYSKWAEIAGKGKIQVLSTPFEQFEKLHGIWGTELGLMVKFWEAAQVPAMWATVGKGDVTVDARELQGIEGRLVTAEESWKQTNWDGF